MGDYVKELCRDAGCGWRVVAFSPDDSTAAMDIHREQRHGEPILTGLDRVVAEWRLLKGPPVEFREFPAPPVRQP